MTAASLPRPRGPLIVVGLVVVGALLVAWMQPGWWAALQGWVRLEQHSLQSELGEATRANLDASPATVWALISLSFVYGVLHAVGPGHGKAVIATYAATTRATARKVARLSFLASLAQALMAIALIYGGLAVFSLSARWATRTAETVLEPASYAAIAALGLYLVWRGWAVWREAAHHHQHGEHEHEHDGDHGHHRDHGHRQHEDHAHRHAHHHHDDAACEHGHSHGPHPALVEAATDWRAQLGAILAIGVRPCSGALIVLAISWAVGVVWTGAAAAIAMGIGTGATVAVLSLLAVGARELALRLTVLDTERAGRVAGLTAMAGGTLIATFALLMLKAALEQPAHPFMS